MIMYIIAYLDKFVKRIRLELRDEFITFVLNILQIFLQNGAYFTEITDQKRHPGAHCLPCALAGLTERR